MDSGALHYFCSKRYDLQTLYSIPNQIEMIIRNRLPILKSAKGTIKLNLSSGRILIIEVLLV
jgi:hypothetical protein